MLLSYDEDLKGKAVLDSAGRHVGEVDGVLIAAHSWAVEAIRVKLLREAADELGVHHRTFRSSTMAVPVGIVHGAGDAVILSVPVKELRQLVTDGATAPAE